MQGIWYGKIGKSTALCSSLSLLLCGYTTWAFSQAGADNGEWSVVEVKQS